MRRMVIGALTGVAIWIGSAMAAEAQQITPTGPLAVNPGSTSSTYTANVYLPSPCAYRVRLWVYMGTTQIHYSETIVANPGVQNSVFTKNASHTAVSGGSNLYYKVAMKVGTQWFPANYPINGEKIEWGPVPVQGTRPSQVTGSVQKAPKLVLQSIDRDRRRE